MIDVNDPRFDAVLYMDDPDFARKFSEAVGLKPGEKLQIATPQFERTDGKKITYVPTTPEQYAALKHLTREGRKSLGMAPWDEREDEELWLFPHQWYAHIPAGLEVVDINYAVEKFEPGKTDDDRRFGLLSFGVMCPNS